MSVVVAGDAATVQEAIREGAPVVPMAGRTHTAMLPEPGGPAIALDVSGISGVVDYDPAELTFTARPGTTLAEIDTMLAANGQRLPFDPPLLAEGATIGGAVAAGITGPDGFAAGVRDFVLGVRFVDGTGRLARGGSKVVKNAAGFDLPKLMVGSLGRLGVIVELSLKVFPRPAATASVRFPTAGLPAGLAAVAEIARGPVPVTALDLHADGNVTARIAGSGELIEARARRLARTVEPTGVPIEDEGSHWEKARHFDWVGSGARLVVIPTAPRQIVALDRVLAGFGAERRYGLGANVAWVAWPRSASLDELSGLLAAEAMSGLVVTGRPSGRPLLGTASGGAFAARVSSGLDPMRIFGEGDAVKHDIPTEDFGARAELLTGPIESCVHCGFCLPTCPTYVTMGEEMDSPRGRIFLIKEVLEGRLEVELAQPYLDNCLGCQACETACPSGVRYGELITEFRGRTEPTRKRPAAERVRRELVLRTLPHRRRFRAAARLGAFARGVRRVVPSTLRPMLDLLPDRLAPAHPLPAIFPAQGERRGRVALLAGCVQQQLDPEIGWAAGRVLARNGIEVIVPAAQGCCGSLEMHAGEAERARASARRNLAAFPADVDAVVTTAAGCGSGMRDYGDLFLGEPEHEAAVALADRTVDVAEFLGRVGLVEEPPPLASARRVAYHDACHLAHAQRVTAAPRQLLAAVEGLELLEPTEAGLCCGSAGIYNVERPEVAAELGERKARNLQATGAELIATGNIGCLTQLQTQLARLGHQIPVIHTVQVLDRAYKRTL